MRDFRQRVAAPAHDLHAAEVGDQALSTRRPAGSGHLPAPLAAKGRVSGKCGGRAIRCGVIGVARLVRTGGARATSLVGCLNGWGVDGPRPPADRFSPGVGEHAPTRLSTLPAFVPSKAGVGLSPRLAYRDLVPMSTTSDVSSGGQRPASSPCRESFTMFVDVAVDPVRYL
jgi:hypothetical protein